VTTDRRQHEAFRGFVDSEANPGAKTSCNDDSIPVSQPTSRPLRRMDSEQTHNTWPVVAKVCLGVADVAKQETTVRP
jgi:hypothetical protein